MSIESIWWSSLPFDLIIGYNHINYNPDNQIDVPSKQGIIFGTKFWLPKPVEASVSGKISICKNIMEYQTEIKRKFGKYGRLNSFVKYYNIGLYTEVLLGIGIEFTYFFRYQRNEY